MAFFLRRNILQRRPLILATLILCLLVSSGLAQFPKRKAKTLRALAIVEWPFSGAPRLIPVTILVDGRYYDAGIYLASPVPMALDSGTVYEVEQSGESVGFYTVYGAQQSRDAWFGEGQWVPRSAMSAAKKTAPADAPRQDDSDKPPVLRRPGSQPPTQPAPPPATAPEPPAPRGPDEPPVLRRPTPPPPSASEPAPAATASASARSRPGDEDSERPILRRGKPGVSQAAGLPGSVTIPTGAQVVSAPTLGPKSAANAKPTRVLAAISDAGGPVPRSYAYEVSPQEQQRLTGLMKSLAGSALQNYAKARPGPRPGALEDVSLRSFDLSYSNSPLLGLTARAGEGPPEPAVRTTNGARRGAKPAPAAESTPPASDAGKDFNFYVTVVAREDFNGNLRQLMVATTDTNHLDAFSRMELIDAIDADGDGRGELLFREISDIGSNFVLYRADPDNLTQLFNGAELER